MPIRGDVMTKGLTVYAYDTDGTEHVFGRAWLTTTGAARIDGFPPEWREHYIRDGIKDRRVEYPYPIVPMTDGERFLDVLWDDYQRPFLRAVWDKA